ncbi:MAG: translation initiation factor IF-2, partial [Rikenellaceae bacterium]
MSKEKRLRLNQAAREFKVGQSTIVELLENRGIKIDAAPNSIIESAAYDILEKEFGANRKAENVNIREKMSIKPEAVSLKDMREDDVVEDAKPIVRTNLISIADEVSSLAPKVVGKIDLDAPKKQDAPEPATISTTPKPQEVKPEPTQAPAVEQAPKQQPEIESTTIEKQVKSVGEAADKVAQPVKKPNVSEQNNNKPQQQQNAKKVKQPSKPIVAKQAEDVITEATQSQTYDQRMADREVEVFRAGSNTGVSGPKVLGKIDVNQFKNNDPHAKREKRKRITKDKVDITKSAPANNPNKGGNRNARPNQGGGQGANQGANQGGYQNRNNNGGQGQGGGQGANQNRNNNGGFGGGSD